MPAGLRRVADAARPRPARRRRPDGGPAAAGRREEGEGALRGRRPDGRRRRGRGRALRPRRAGAAARAGRPAGRHRGRAVHQAGRRRAAVARQAAPGARHEPADVRHVRRRRPPSTRRCSATSSSLAREVAALERQVRAEREAETPRARGRAPEAELRAALADVARRARASTDRRRGPARARRAARAGRLPRRGRAAGGAAGASGGAIRLRLEATEDDPGRAGRLEAYARALSAAGPRIVHVGAGSGRALELLGRRRRGRRARRRARGRGRGRRAGRCATPTRSPTWPRSTAGLGRRHPRHRPRRADRRRRASSRSPAPIERALAPEGVAIVEGLDPAGLGDDGAFWRDPGRRRPVHPDAVRMALESAGPRVDLGRGARRARRRAGVRAATPCMPRADGPRVAFVVPRYGAGVVGRRGDALPPDGREPGRPRRRRRGADDLRGRPLHLGRPPPRGHDASRTASRCTASG